ncbi:MAG: glycine--tRNA ligase [Candidatus Altimarinota bacterium]
MEKNNLMDKVISLCKRRGFVFPGSEIYGGLANTWDYGPLGSQLKKNIKDLWWKTFVEQRTDMVGLDAAILMNPTTWEASGHVVSFSDPLMDCRKCKARVRADKMIEQWQHENNSSDKPANWAGEKTPPGDLLNFINEKKITCPHCKNCDWTEPKSFNLMFKTKQGVVEEDAKDIYLRPETAQGIFVNFKNVLETSRKKLPFGIAQIGKSFRNEITPGNFIFRTREFEQMEIEYFFDPEQTPWEPLFKQWQTQSLDFVQNKLGMDPTRLRLRDHDPDELSHYSKGTTDIEFNFPFGWGELCAAGAYRTDYDLKQHQQYSGEKLTYRDPYTNKELVPHVLEPSYGVERLLLGVLLSAYHEEQVAEGDERIVMKFKPDLAPITIAVLPLSNKLNESAEKVQQELQKHFRTDFDVSGSIGKRYRRYDEVGTPFCLTYDFDSETDQSVTIRYRDSMTQERVKISELVNFIKLKLES